MQHRSFLINLLIITLFLALISGPASAADPGDWIVRIGATGVFTEDFVSDPVTTAATGALSGTAVGANDAWSLGLTIGKVLTPNWSIEVLAAYPFNNDILANGTLRDTLAGLGLSGDEVIGEIDHLPPVVSFLYTFGPDNSARPYVGVGLNYFLPFNEKVKGDLVAAGYTDLEVDDSFGLALQVGADFDLTDRLFLNLSARWVDIEVDAKVTGGILGDITVDSIEVDPYVYSLMLGTSF